MSSKKSQPRFNPCDITDEQSAKWVREGDFEEAKGVALSLALFIGALAKNKDAQAALMSAGIPLVGAHTMTLIYERLIANSSSAAGKSGKSGSELFAKVLVPNKPTRSQFLARWLASVADMNLSSSSKANYEDLARRLNEAIVENNRLLESRKFERYSPAMPSRKVTADQIEKAYRKYRSEIEKANGIHRHKIK